MSVKSPMEQYKKQEFDRTEEGSSTIITADAFDDFIEQQLATSDNVAESDETIVVCHAY